MSWLRRTGPGDLAPLHLNMDIHDDAAMQVLHTAVYSNDRVFDVLDEMVLGGG